MFAKEFNTPPAQMSFLRRLWFVTKFITFGLIHCALIVSFVGAGIFAMFWVAWHYMGF